MSDQVFNFDTDFGARYDEFVRTFVPGYESMFNMTLALLQTELGPKAKVLVVGSGTGNELVTFGKAMPGWTFTAVEPSPRMMGQCQVKLEKAALTDRVELHEGYLDNLPPGELFDAATLILVLHFVPDNGSQYGLLRGISQRLKRGGTFILVQHHGDTQSVAFHHMLSAWTNYHILRGMPPERANQLFEEASKTHHFVPEARTLDLLNSAGFGEVERFYTAFITGGWLARKKQAPAQAS